MPRDRIPLKSYHYRPQGRRRNVGENSRNSGDGTDQTGPILDDDDDDDDDDDIPTSLARKFRNVPAVLVDGPRGLLRRMWRLLVLRRTALRLRCCYQLRVET